MRLPQLLRATALAVPAFLVAGASISPAAQSTGLVSDRPAAELTSSGSARVIRGPFFGLNGARIISPSNAALWHSPAFSDAIAKVGPGFLRVQGGTTSQWLNWHTGAFIESAKSPFKGQNAGRKPLTVQDWTNLVRRSGAEPLYDLNVVTSTLTDQIAMLKAYQRLGLPVRHVELGNELYVGDATYTALYPTGADYARAMNTWISALHRAFPHVQVAVAAADTSNWMISSFYGKRYSQWNSAMYPVLRGADAVTFHPYWFPTAVDANAATAGSGLDAWKAFARQDLAAVPGRLKVWLTEFNQMDVPLSEAGLPAGVPPPAKQTWAVGLSLASYVLAALSDARVSMAVVHSALNGLPSADSSQAGGNMEVQALLSDGSGGSTALGLTAENIALTPIFRTLRAASERRAIEVQPVTLSNGPVALGTLYSPIGSGPVAGVVGVRLSDGTLLMVNLSGQDTSISLPTTSKPQTATTWMTHASTRPAFTPGDHVTVTSSAVSGSLDLPAYSEVLVAHRS